MARTTNKNLLKLRRREDAASAIGHRCSNLMEMRGNLKKARIPEQRAALKASIARMELQLHELHQADIFA